MLQANWKPQPDFRPIAAQSVSAVRRPLNVHHKDIGITPAAAQILLHFSGLKIRLNINCVFASYAMTILMPE